MVALIFWKLLAIVEFTIHAIKLSPNANETLFLLITLATKLELNNKYKIGNKSDF